MPKMGLLLFIFIVVVLVFTLGRTDDTDKSFFERSGMHLYTDHKTGLQYLSAPGGLLGGRGPLIPRLDAEGKHMRIKE